MQHIINIAFDFDDDNVKQIAEYKVKNEMDAIIEEIVTDKIAPPSPAWHYNAGERDWDDFDMRLSKHITAFLDSHRDEIMDRAATKLTESVKRTKLWKEKYSVMI